MQPEERDNAYLWDMLDAAQAIAEFVHGKTYHDYETNRMLRSAVERNIEIIGEAARRISETTQKKHPKIPWRSIIGQRNFWAHEYDEILHEAIWKLAINRIPELVNMLIEIMPEDYK